jgi:hypothetical protein
MTPADGGEAAAVGFDFFILDDDGRNAPLAGTATSK